MAESKSTFIWKIPRFTDDEVDYICNGYIRNESNIYVPIDVINVCKNYYKNDFKLNGSLSPKDAAHFKSGMFAYNGIKFYMTFEKGQTKDTLFDTSSEWNIIIPYLPKNISKIDILCRNTVTYKQKSTLNNKITMNKFLKYDKVHTETFGTPENNDDDADKPEMKITDCFTLTDMQSHIYSFSLAINTLLKYDNNKQLIEENKNGDIKMAETHFVTDDLYSCGGYVWNIHSNELEYMKKAEPGSYFVSSLFNVRQFKWMMKLSYYDDISYGSSADFCLYLTSLSNKIKQLNIRYKLWFVELNKLIDTVYIFKTNNRSLWKLDLFHVDDIKEFTQLTVNIEILILDIFYEHKDDEKNIINPLQPCLQTLDGCYEWKISDAELVNKIKTVKTGVDFESKIFCLKQFKWFLKFYPNGYSANYSGSTDLFLRLASLPPNISHISANYQLMLDEKNTKHFTVSQFSSKSASFGWNKLKNTDIQNINVFTFRTVIKIIDVFDRDGNNITNQFITHNDEDMVHMEDRNETPVMPLVRFVGKMPNYIWRIDGKEMLHKIKNAVNGEQFESNIFRMGSLQWMVKIYPNGEAEADIGNGDMLIYLVSLSPKLKGMCIFYKISLLELGVTKNSTVGLTHSRMKWWTENMWKLQDIETLNSLTFELNIQILDIFDKKGHNINDEYDNIFNENVEEESKENIKITRKYKWEINNAAKVNHFKQSPQTVSFKSGYYKLNTVKLFMHFLPNNQVKRIASGDEKKEEMDMDINKTKYCSFGFTLCSIPPNIFSLTLKFSLEFKEANKSFTNIDQFSNEYNIVNWNLNPKLYKSDILEFDAFTFEVQITVIAVYNVDGNNIMSSFGRDSEEKEEYGEAISIHKMRYEWMIKDINKVNEMKAAQNGKHFMSPIFKMYDLKWFLQFIPSPAKKDEIREENKDEEGTSLFISLASLSPKIKYISMHYELLLSEVATATHQYCTQLTNNIGDMAVSWRTSTLKRCDILKLEHFTFSVVIAIIDIYDQDSNNITQQFNESYSNENKSMDIVECSMDESIAMDHYIWDIDGDTLQRVKNAKNGGFIMSETFKMHGLKWKMQICPNGSTPKRNGIFNWYFIMISLPPKISKIALFYKILLLETGTNDQDLIEMQCKGTLWGWGQKKLKYSDVLNLNKITFKIEIKIIDMFDENGNNINMTNIDENIIYPPQNDHNDHELTEFIWKINDKLKMNIIKTELKIGQCLTSQYVNICGYDWFLSFYPCGKDEKEKFESKLYVNLKILPKDIVGISFYFELYIKETSSSFNNYAHFRNDYLSRSWETTRIKITQIQHLNELTFTLKIKIVDVYPK